MTDEQEKENGGEDAPGGRGAVLRIATVKRKTTDHLFAQSSTTRGQLTAKFSGGMRATDAAPASENVAPHDVRWNALLYSPFCLSERL